MEHEEPEEVAVDSGGSCTVGSTAAAVESHVVVAVVESAVEVEGASTTRALSVAPAEARSMAVGAGVLDTSVFGHGFWTRRV